MTKPYDQDAESERIDVWNREDVRILSYDDNGWRVIGMNPEAQTITQARRRSTLHSIVSHLRRYWELYMAVIILLLLSFVLGYGYARETIVCETPTEDSSLAGCEYKDGGWYSE